MKETRSNFIIILVGDKSYLNEGQKLSNLKRHTNHLFPSNSYVCSITIFSSSILFYNVNNNF